MKVKFESEHIFEGFEDMLVGLGRRMVTLQDSGIPNTYVFSDGALTLEFMRVVGGMDHFCFPAWIMTGVTIYGTELNTIGDLYRCMIDASDLLKRAVKVVYNKTTNYNFECLLTNNLRKAGRLTDNQVVTILERFKGNLWACDEAYNKFPVEISFDKVFEEYEDMLVEVKKIGLFPYMGRGSYEYIYSGPTIDWPKIIFSYKADEDDQNVRIWNVEVKLHNILLSSYEAIGEIFKYGLEDGLSAKWLHRILWILFGDNRELKHNSVMNRYHISEAEAKEILQRLKNVKLE